VEWGGVPQPVSWRAGLRPRQVDWLVFLGAVLFSVPALVHAGLNQRPWIAVGWAVLPFGTVPLLWRRTRPSLMLAVLAAAFAVSAVVVRAEPTGVGLLCGVYAAAVYGDRRVRVVAGAVAGGVLAVASGVVLATGSVQVLGHLTAVAFGYGVFWVHGDRARTRRAYLAELEARAARLERERDEHATRAAERERDRIARELHDVVAHHVSVIAVQAGAARITAQSDPARAVATLGLIERTARSTLGELRALLGVLRKDTGSAPPRRPQPTVEQLDELIGPARAAGVRLESRVDGAVRPLAPLADLCAYRLVQEALTNVLKHAPGATVRLRLCYSTDELRITVLDDGPRRPGAEPDDPPPAGHGLVGMRERVALTGGRLRAGPTAGGGFRVEAWLPLAAAGSTPTPDTDSPGTDSPDTDSPGTEPIGTEPIGTEPIGTGAGTAAGAATAPQRSPAGVERRSAW
jgi:signal transduction histidine kinase